MLVRFPDFGWGVTDGADREETFSEARHRYNLRSRLLQQAPQTVKPRRAALEPSFQPSVVHPLTHIRDGITFRGWRLFPDHRRLLRGNGVRFRRRLLDLKMRWESGAITWAEVRQAVAAWVGH